MDFGMRIRRLEWGSDGYGICDLGYEIKRESRRQETEGKGEMRYAIWDMGAKSFNRISQISHHTSL